MALHPLAVEGELLCAAAIEKAAAIGQTCAHVPDLVALSGVVK